MFRKKNSKKENKKVDKKVEKREVDLNLDNKESELISPDIASEKKNNDSEKKEKDDDRKGKNAKGGKESTDDSNVIEFINVTKKFPDGTKALDDVSFTINKGEFVFLIGSSGAGKTSLMRQIVKEETPTKGKVVVDGFDLSKLKRKNVPYLRRKVGFVFQDFKLLKSRTVFENVAVSLEVVGKKKSEINDVVDNLLNLVGLEDKKNKFPAHLSGGERQRLSIARALAHEPTILLADEPTGNLDTASTWVVVDLIEKINKWGTAIIFGTHSEPIVNKLKKRVIHIEKGKIISDKKEGKYE